MKRGSGYKTITPVPRRRSDPEFAKWENDVNPMLYDDYEGSNHTIYIRCLIRKEIIFLRKKNEIFVYHT